MAALFGRERELSALQQRIGAGKIVLVLGPQNSGKTALVRQLQRTAWLPVYFLDMRSDIAFQAAKWPDQVDGSQCIDVMFRELGAVNGRRGKRPIFIIDHADKIKALPDAKQISETLRSLAQDRVASVVMASTEDSVREDLIGDAFTDVVYVDHFGREQAKEFLYSLLERKQKQSAGNGWSWWRPWSRKNRHCPPPVSNEDFDKIYRVCAGCPLLLKRCAQQAYLLDSKPLDHILGGMADSLGGLIWCGLIGGEWDGDKFGKVMELMMERDGGVEWSTVCSEAFGGDDQQCSSQLRAMAASYVIHIKSIPAERIKMVLPVSPAQLQAMTDELLRECNDD